MTHTFVRSSAAFFPEARNRSQFFDVVRDSPHAGNPHLSDLASLDQLAKASRTETQKIGAAAFIDERRFKRGNVFCGVLRHDHA
jgi:hypothetical protein